MEDGNRFFIKKLPEIPQFEEIYNVRLGKDEFIVDRENLLKLKADIEKLLIS